MRRDFTHSGEIMTKFGEISPNRMPVGYLSTVKRRYFAAIS